MPAQPRPGSGRIIVHERGKLLWQRARQRGAPGAQVLEADARAEHKALPGSGVNVVAPRGRKRAAEMSL